MPLPEYGKWRLKHPLLGDNPPFPILEVDLSNKTGAAGLNMQWYPLLYMIVRPGDSVFVARYKVGSHHGMLEATYLNDQSLKVEFSGGTVETTCDGQLISARGVVQGVPSPPVSSESVASKYQIHCAGDIARWFDGLVMENEHELKRLCDNFAKRNPDSWIAVGMANTARDLYSVVAHQGQGLVDTLRLGEGCYEGGWGIGKDFLRALNFLPAFKQVRPLANRISALRGAGGATPAAKAAAAEANIIRSTAEAGARPYAPVPRPIAAVPPPILPGLRGPLAKDPGKGICWAVATVNAMQQLRGRFWMPVSKLLRLSRVNVWEERLAPGSSGAFIREVKDVLGKFGVHLCQLTNFKACVSQGEEIVNLVKNCAAGSVILFSVQWVTKAGEKAAHALVAWKDPQGTVYIIDRTAEETGKLVKSLAELDALFPNSGYTGIANSVIQEAYRLEDCSGGFVRQGAKLLFAIGFTTTLAVQDMEAQKTNQQR